MTKETVLDCDFLILNRVPALHSAQRFLSEIRHLNLNAELVTPEWLIENATQFETRDLSLGVLYRQGDFNFWPTQAALSQLPFRIVNSPTAFIKARDKWITARFWQQQNIPQPFTLPLTDILPSDSSLTSSALFESAKNQLGLPFILKKRFSSQGYGVFLIHDEEALSSILQQDADVFKNSSQIEIDYFSNESDQYSLSANWVQYRRWLVQPCIHESLGRDVRVFFINENDFAIERRNEHSFRSNLHQGGQSSITTLSETERKLCQKIHKQSGLIYSGIDFLRTEQGPRFLEINPSPGFEGIERAYDHNIAKDLLDVFLK